MLFYVHLRAALMKKGSLPMRRMACGHRWRQKRSWNLSTPARMTSAWKTFPPRTIQLQEPQDQRLSLRRTQATKPPQESLSPVRMALARRLRTAMVTLAMRQAPKTRSLCCVPAAANASILLPLLAPLLLLRRKWLQCCAWSDDFLYLHQLLSVYGCQVLLLHMLQYLRGGQLSSVYLQLTSPQTTPLHFQLAGADPRPTPTTTIWSTRTEDRCRVGPKSHGCCCSTRSLLSTLLFWLTVFSCFVHVHAASADARVAPVVLAGAGASGLVRGEAQGQTALPNIFPSFTFSGLQPSTRSLHASTVRKRAFARAIRRASQAPDGSTMYRGRRVFLQGHRHLVPATSRETGGPRAGPAQRLPTKKPRLRVLSHNVGGLDSVTYDTLMQWLPSAPFDVVCLQEIHHGLGKESTQWAAAGWRYVTSVDPKFGFKECRSCFGSPYAAQESFTSRKL